MKHYTISLKKPYYSLNLYDFLVSVIVYVGGTKIIKTKYKVENNGGSKIDFFLYFTPHNIFILQLDRHD